MILLTPEQAAEEFRIARRTIAYWVTGSLIRSHPRPPREGGHGGSPGYWVERAQVAERVRLIGPRGGRPSRSRGSRPPQPAPRPTSHPHPADD